MPQDSFLYERLFLCHDGRLKRGDAIARKPESKDSEDVVNMSKNDIATPEDGTPNSMGDLEKQAQGQVSSPQTESPTQEEEMDPSIVEFDGPNDPDNPKNWTAKRRAIITVAMGLMTFVVTFSSSIFAVAIEPVAEEFDVGIPVATLGVSFFLLVSTLSHFSSLPATDEDRVSS